MPRCIFLLLFSGLLLVGEKTFSQAAGKGTVRGRVIDSVSAVPLGFASIRIFDSEEKKLVDGNITNESGEFSVSVPYGKYYAEVEFMGYEPYITQPFTLPPCPAPIALG